MEETWSFTETSKGGSHEKGWTVSLMGFTRADTLILPVWGHCCPSWLAIPQNIKEWADFLTVKPQGSDEVQQCHRLPSSRSHLVWGLRVWGSYEKVELFNLEKLFKWFWLYYLSNENLLFCKFLKVSNNIVMSLFGIWHLVFNFSQHLSPSQQK